MLARYGAAGNLLSVPEDNFAAGGVAEFMQQLFIDLVAHGQRAGHAVVGSRAEIYRLNKYFVEVPSSKPPVVRGFFLKGLMQEFLGEFLPKPWTRSV